MEKDTIRYCFESTKANSYMMLAKRKFYEARHTLCYSDYQLDNARWRISYDVFKVILKDFGSYPYFNNKTLYGLPVDICDGVGILKLYVEV